MSFKIKDNRVDREIIKLGFAPEACEIFYSPIAAWLWPHVMWLALFAYPLVAYFPISIPILLCWFCIGYLLAAWQNCSFALTSRQMLAINPNFPFKKRVVCDFEAITSIRIDKSPTWHWMFFPFLIARGKFLHIQTTTKAHTCYCAELRLDVYDENFTDKSLDDLYLSLKNKGLEVEFRE